MPKQRAIRFSRPSSRVLLANSAVISNHEGLPTLMVRLANERHNVIRSAARIRIDYGRFHDTFEG